MEKEEQIREEILRYLYEAQKNAMSVERALKNQRQIIHSLQDRYERPEIVRNLLYLLDTGWIKTKKQSGYDYYLIKEKGVNHFEGPSSIFKKAKYFSGINITNINGITVVGDHNLVQKEYTELYENLETLRLGLGESEKIPDSQKLNYQSEIETIKSQLAKERPNKNIIEQAWSALSGLSTIASLLDLYHSIEPVIKQIMH